MQLLLQGNILEDELSASPQTEGRYLSFRNRLKPIAFASKSLSDAETRYSNIERETTRCSMGCGTLPSLHFCQQN